MKKAEGDILLGEKWNYFCGWNSTGVSTLLLLESQASEILFTCNSQWLFEQEKKKMKIWRWQSKVSTSVYGPIL